MKLRLLEDRVAVELIEAVDTTPGGILLPEKAKERPTRGKVFAVGPGRWDQEGRTVAMTVKVGDTVVFSKNGGTYCNESHYGGPDKEFRILRESEVWAIQEE